MIGLTNITRSPCCPITFGLHTLTMSNVYYPDYLQLEKILGVQEL